MDSTIAIIGILAVVVALCAYIFVPEWLRGKRMRRELQWHRCAGRVPKPGPWPDPPPAPPPDHPPDQPN